MPKPLNIIRLYHIKSIKTVILSKKKFIDKETIISGFLLATGLRDSSGALRDRTWDLRINRLVSYDRATDPRLRVECCLTVTLEIPSF